MNYIKQLEQKTSELSAQLADVHNELTALMVYLDSPKFTGTAESQGCRNYVNASEMRQRVASIRMLTL